MNWWKEVVKDIDIYTGDILTGNSRSLDQRTDCLLLTEHLSTTSQPSVPTRLCGEGLMLPVLHVQWDCTIGGEHQHYETFIGCWQICPSSSAERETPLLWKVNKSSLVRIR